MSSVDWILRKGDVSDVVALAGPLKRRRALFMVKQARESELFTVEDPNSGRLLVAGGFWPWPDDHPYDEAWMLTNQAVELPARIMIQACLTVLEARPEHRAVVASIRIDKPAHMRFAQFLGFESYHLPVIPILRRECQLMVWRP
jgi:hypothetical protein